MTVRQRSDHTLVELRGELDSSSSLLAIARMARLIESGVSRAVLNLRGILFIDSAGLDAILRISHDLRDKGGSLAVSSPSIFSRSLMERIGLDRIVPILDSDEEAIAALSAEPQERVVDMH